MGPIPEQAILQVINNQGGGGTPPDPVPFSDFAEFLAKSPAEKYASNPIILHDATYTNICPGSNPIEDPLDSTKLLMRVGEFQGNTSTDARVATYRASKSNLYSWTRVGTFVSKGANSVNHDQNGCRFGCNVVHNGTVYDYYIGQQGTSGNDHQAVCLATSTDGVTATKLGAVVNADQVNEFNLTDPFVFIDDDDVWYMYVTAKTTSLPTLGIRIYTSNDGITWTRTGTNAVALGSARAYDGKYIEGCSVFKTPAGEYVMLYTTSSNGNIWSTGVCKTSSPNSAFTKEAVPWFQYNITGWDSGSVAVPFYYQDGTNWYIFYQGTTQFQPADTWDVGIAQLTATPDTFPPGQLPGFGGWTGDAFFRTLAVVAGLEYAVQALNNTGFSTVICDYPISVFSGVNSYFEVIIRTNSASGAFRGGFYIMEGSNQCTGIYFNSGNISHLRSAGWTTLQGYSANTNYTIRINITSNSTYTVNVNGVLVGGSNALFANITTKIDKVRLEKAQQSTALVYFGSMVASNLGTPATVNIGQ